jgi:asparagine synthase (glutamine-hydrolysing)
MCGIGAIVQRGLDEQTLEISLRALEKAQLHRGPDGSAISIEPIAQGADSRAALLGLAHQRLAILDRSPRANQPLNSACGRYVLCYNGEIYNYQELATGLRQMGAELPLDVGDSAVLLACLIRWGAQALPKLNGMWAFAFYDRQEALLLVSRDRMGVKPLYWTVSERGVFFASEIKGLLAATGLRYPLNESVVAQHLAQSLCNTDTQTLFKGIAAVPAASFAQIDLGSAGDLTPQFQRFWQHPFELQAPLQDEADPEYLCFLLQDATRLRLRSDVPCGLLLSGGLDSSAILAAAHAQQMQLQVLSVISKDPASSEEYWVKQMARHCGIQPVWVQIDEDPMSVLAMVAQQRLMQAAKDQGMVVLLSGQGADEQLGGYNKFLYFYLRELLAQQHYVGAASQAWDCFARGTVWHEFKLGEAKRYLPGFGVQRESILGPRLLGAGLCDTAWPGSYLAREWRDMHSLSVPLLLHSEDRMSMSCGRETRHPFMDFRVVEFLATVPTRQKFQRGWPKWILREAMRHDMPSSITWRRDKKGFNVPEGQWLKTVFTEPLQKWFAEPLLCVEHGLVNLPALKASYQRYLQGAPGASYKDVLGAITLEAWMRVNEGHLAPG